MRRDTGIAGFRPVKKKDYFFIFWLAVVYVSYYYNLVNSPFVRAPLKKLTAAVFAVLR